MSLVAEEEFRDGSDITQLIECGPRLVTGGVPLPRTKQEARVPRTFIATDGGKRWCIGVTGPVGLTELAALLTTPGIMDECPVHQALNLDGGPSTSLAWHDESGTIQTVPQKPAVRNYVQVVPIKLP
jgi:exopolysaccharide biosynthesis protein